MRAVVMGAVEGTRVALRSIAMSPGWSLAGVVTLPPQLSNRHSDFVDIGAAAAEFGSEIIQTATGTICSRQAGPVVIARCVICHRMVADLPPAMLKTVAWEPSAITRTTAAASRTRSYSLDDPARRADPAGTLFWIDEGTDTGAI